LGSIGGGRLAVAVVAAAVLSATVAACGGGGSASGSSSGPIKIGVIQPFSGPYASYANDIERGYELAVKNAGGEIDGRKIELVKGDASSAQEGITEVRRLISQEHVNLLTGTYISDVAAAASEVAAREHLVYWENHSLANELTERGLESFIRVAPKAETFAQTSAEFITGPLAESLHKKPEELTVFIEHESSEYGSSIGAGQAKVLKAAGVNVIEDSHNAAATDLTDAVLQAKNANPDVWLITGYVPDVNLLLRQADEQGFHPAARVLTATGDSDETLEAVGASNLAGTFVVQYSNPDTNPKFAPGWKKFLAEYKQEFGGEPLGGVSMVGYTGLTVLMKVLEAADGDTSVEAMKKATDELNIPVGGLPNGWGAKFNEENQNEKVALLVGQWHQDGTLPTVYPKAAAVTSIESPK
jgi:branched-chain amino acid transport system substrate-binding protein